MLSDLLSLRAQISSNKNIRMQTLIPEPGILWREAAGGRVPSGEPSVPDGHLYHGWPKLSLPQKPTQWSTQTHFKHIRYNNVAVLSYLSVFWMCVCVCVCVCVPSPLWGWWACRWRSGWTLAPYPNWGTLHSQPPQWNVALSWKNYFVTADQHNFFFFFLFLNMFIN